MEMTWLDLSSSLGLVATIVLVLNMLMGMMLGTAYKKHKFWKQIPKRFKRFSLYDLHNWTAYVALLFVLLHPLLLLFDPQTKFKALDIVFPINAPHQKLFVAFGTLALFALVVILISTQKKVRKKMTFRTWKNVHLISYGTAILFLLHGIVLDPQLKDRPVDFIDAEKLVSEMCALVLLLAVVLRYRYHLRTKKRNELTLSKKSYRI